MKQHGPWTIVSSEEKYHSPWLDVREDAVVRPDGSNGTFSLATLADGSTVLPMDQDGNVYLVQQFRYAVGEESIEIASGGIDAGESPEAAARRELQEELGITAKEWIDLGSTDPFTSGVKSTAYLFLVRDLIVGTASPDGTEPIKLLKVPFDEAYAMALDGRMRLAQCVVLMFRAKEYLSKESA